MVVQFSSVLYGSVRFGLAWLGLVWSSWLGKGGWLFHGSRDPTHLLTRVLLRENIGGKLFALFENTARAMRFSLQIAEEFCPMFLHWLATRNPSESIRHPHHPMSHFVLPPILPRSNWHRLSWVAGCAGILPFSSFALASEAEEYGYGDCDGGRKGCSFVFGLVRYHCVMSAGCRAFAHIFHNLK